VQSLISLILTRNSVRRFYFFDAHYPLWQEILCYRKPKFRSSELRCFPPATPFGKRHLSSGRTAAPYPRPH
jgi:hypothetical protein